MKYIKVAEANCQNCYKCLKVCPVKSIRYSDNHVEVLEIDLVTEGVLTIKKALELLELYEKDPASPAVAEAFAKKRGRPACKAFGGELHGDEPLHGHCRQPRAQAYGLPGGVPRQDEAA